MSASEHIPHHGLSPIFRTNITSKHLSPRYWYQAMLGAYELDPSAFAQWIAIQCLLIIITELQMPTLRASISRFLRKLANTVTSSKKLEIELRFSAKAG
jgi:hypothetical protein